MAWTQAPGGVSTNLRVWLKADNGFTPASWTDHSGAGNTYSQTNATRQPAAVAAAAKYNFNPAVHFASDFMVVPAGRPFTSNNKNGTVFVIVNHTSLVGNQDYLGFGATTSGSALINANEPTTGMAGTSGNPYWYDGDWPISTGIANEVGLTNLLDFRWTYGLTVQPLYIAKNGVLGYSSNVLTNLIKTSEGSVLGSQPEDLQADVCEVIAFEENLTGTDLQKIRTYLALKYGITINQSYLSATGTTIFDITNYGNNVAGIGREDVQGLHQKQAQSVNKGIQPLIGLTTIEASNATNTAILSDASYMVWGSDTGVAKFYTAITAPAGSIANNRLNRIWKVQETGTVGTVKFAVPQIGMGSTVYLLRSTDATFDATDTWIPLSNLTVGSETYLAADVDFANGNYFTIATFIAAPGCVEADLKMWFKADAGVTGTTQVTDWADQSSNGYDVIQATANQNPSVAAASSAFNFNPSLKFDGLNSHLEYKGARFMTTTSAGSVFGVASNVVDNGGYENLADLGIDNPHMGIQNSTMMQWMNGSVPVQINHSTTITKDQTQQYSWHWNGGTGGGLEMRLDGTPFSEPNADYTLVGNGGTSDGMFTIGGYEAVEVWNGNISEVIVYARNLTQAEKERVASYLAIKYGTTLKHNYLSGSGSTIYDTTSYANNIGVIGRDNCQGLNQKQSHSVNAGIQPTIGLTSIAATNAENTALLTDNSFMAWGSNTATASFGTAITAPSGSIANFRMNRVWKVQETGTVGTVKFAMPSSLGTGGTVYLIRSTNNTFDATDTWIPLSNLTVGSESYVAGDIDFNNGDYFTIATFLAGPGGVTDVDFWVKSDNAGNIATAWHDNSAASNPIEAVGSWSLSPADAAHNFHPYTTGFTSTKYFKDEASSLTSDNTFGVNTRTPFAVFSAVKPNGPTGRIIGIDNDELFAAEPGFSIQNNKPYFYKFYETAGADVHSLATTNGQTSVLSFNATQLAANSSNMQIGKDGVYENNARTGYWHNLGENLVLGYGTWDLNAAFPGDIMEIAWYKRTLSANEQDRVNSYLGIKNGVTLEINYLASNSQVIWNRSTSTGFNNNIFGIGRDDASGLNQKQAKSTNAVAKMTIGVADSIASSNAMHPAAFTADINFIVIGDNGLTGVITPSVSGACPPPPSADKASAQKFKITETGSVQSIKVQFNPSGLGYNNLYPVYMQVASDSNFTNLIANVPMQWSGANVSTNYNFDANSTSYVRFMGNTTSLANICIATKAQTFYYNGWNYGVKTKDIIANYGTTANAGDMVMKTTVTDGTPNVLLYRPTVDWWPVYDGYGLFYPRKGNASTENSTIITKIEFLSQATTGAANASATKLAANTVDFMIWDLDGYIGSRDIVKVYGKLSGQTVDAKLTRNKYTALTLNHGGDPQSVIGGVLPWDLSYWGRLYVSFDSPVEEVYIEYKQDATYAFNSYQDFRLGPITATCKAPTPEVVTPDNVYIHKEVQTPVKSGDNAAYKFTIQNLNCGDKTINISDILPAGSGMMWVDSSLATTLTIGTTNNYGNTTTLTLGNMTVPAGTSYLYVEAKTATEGTFNNEATYTVGGNNYVSDDPTVSGANNPTPVTVIANDPEANLTITKSVDKATEAQNGILTYTLTVNNPNLSAVTATVTDNLPPSSTGITPTYVAASLTGASGATVSPYAGESSLTIRDLSVPANGSVTLTVQANIGSFTIGDTIRNIASVVPDVSAGYRLTNSFTASANTIVTAPCAAGTIAPSVSATTLSNTCPATTANLSTITAGNLPIGAHLTWHTATPASLANKVADSTAVAAGTYYAVFYDFTNDCFAGGGSATTAVTVTINLCTSTVSVAAKAFLSGAYVQADGMMHDSLRAKNLIPTAQPYTSMGHSGAETVNPSILATTGANAIVDWVLVELRSDTSTVVVRKAGLLQRDGDIVDTDGISPLSITTAAGNYYVAVRHRNHLGVMIASPIALSSTATTIDFTIAATATFQKGGAQGSPHARRSFGTVRALWAGNANSNANLKASGAGSDTEAALLKVLLDIGNSQTLSSYIIYNQYYREDANMDGKVVYQGSGSELDAVLFNILLHDSNIHTLASFVIYEQIP